VSALESADYAIFRVPGLAGDRLEVALDSGGGGLAIRRDGELAITLPIAERDHARIRVLDRDGRPLDKIDADVSRADGLSLEQLGAGVTVSNFSVHVTREDLLDPLAPARLHADVLDPRGKPLEIRDLDWLLDDNFGTLVPDPRSYFDREIRQRLDAPIPLTLCTEARRLCWDTTLPLANRAAVIRRTGMVDANLDIGAVANADHTIVIRFMAQFPRSYTAPLFSNGSFGYYDQYQVSIEGSGPRPSTEVTVTLSTGGYNYAYPVSTFETNTGAGNWPLTNPTYAPAPVPSLWHHLAVTRTSNEMRVYLDGIEILPASGIRPVIPTGLTIAGPVRLGDRPRQQFTAEQQFFGLIDDFGMFSTAKSATEIAVLAGAARLSPSEPDLVAYDTFDGISHATFTGESWSAYVSATRSATLDQPVLPMPFQTSTLRLPFIAPEVWTVVQEFDSDYSHRGGAAFSWDFIFVPDALVQSAATGGPTGPATGNCTPSIGRRVLATVDATVTNVGYRTPDGHGYVAGLANGSPPTAPEYTWTEHLEDRSQRPIVGDSITANTVIGQVHAADCHVHVSYDTEIFGNDRTIPMAFSDYEVSRDYGRTWSHVSLGMPRIGEWVRRSGSQGRIIDTACTPEMTRQERTRLACP
jgi:hypothetical protein